MPQLNHRNIVYIILKMWSMDDAVEMTTNQYQQNISVKLADDF